MGTCGLLWSRCEGGRVGTHLSLMMVCNSRIWSLRGSSLSCGPRFSWLGSVAASLGSEPLSTAGTPLLLANRTCFTGWSWPLVTLFICWLWHGILGGRSAGLKGPRQRFLTERPTCWRFTRCLTKTSGHATCSVSSFDPCFKVRCIRLTLTTHGHWPLGEHSLTSRQPATSC